MTRYHCKILPLDEEGNPQEPEMVPFTREEEAAADATENEWNSERRLREIDGRLNELDMKLPRAIEDVLQPNAYLYPIKLEKQSLRTERKALEAETI